MLLDRLRTPWWLCNGAAEQRPTLKPSWFQCMVESVGCSLAMQLLTSLTLNSPRSKRAFARYVPLLGSTCSSWCDAENASWKSCLTTAARGMLPPPAQCYWRRHVERRQRGHEKVQPWEWNEVRRYLVHVRIELAWKAHGRRQMRQQLCSDAIHAVEPLGTATIAVVAAAAAPPAPLPFRSFWAASPPSGRRCPGSNLGKGPDFSHFASAN